MSQKSWFLCTQIFSLHPKFCPCSHHTPPSSFEKQNNFKLRKVNHTLGDHRSGRAWDSNHGPNETDGRHMSEKTKNLRKKLPKKKNEKFSEKKNQAKKNTKKHLVWYPCLCPLWTARLIFFLQEKKSHHKWNFGIFCYNFGEIFLGGPCVVLCGIIKTQKQKTEKSLFKKHSGLFLDYCGRKPVKISP